MPPSDDSFAAAYARKPATAPRGLLPERRVLVAAAALVTLGVLVVVPLQLYRHRPVHPVATEAPPAYPAAVDVPQLPASSAAAAPAPSSQAPAQSAQPATATTQAPPKPAATTAGATAAPPATKPATATTKAAAPPAPAIPGRAIVGVQSGLCLSANAGTDGAALTIARCNGSAVQHWEALSDGTIRSVGLCMDAAWASTDNLTQIQVARCSGNPAQQWRLNTSTNDLVDVQANKCADVYQQGTAPGSSVKLFPCNGQSNQKWYWK
ncbi:RICIN domain-containing protein [Dactylosporangium salmoneum]|uniref:Ricin B lectin domain-containing protein n=1 Tax=Dactylosporangium salmoneum TaxID=53361 RepID=A0ABP5T316_9ACTN